MQVNPSSIPSSLVYFFTIEVLSVKLAAQEFACVCLNLQASDRFNINSQLEHLQAKYVGTGHADMNRL